MYIFNTFKILKSLVFRLVLNRAILYSKFNFYACNYCKCIRIFHKRKYLYNKIKYDLNFKYLYLQLYKFIKL